MKPYYDEAGITIYNADCRELLADVDANCTVTDPPYGETSLQWDRWTPFLSELRGNSLWCFGTLRMFMVRVNDFNGGNWKLSHDAVWEKHNGSGFLNDRLRKVHEQIAHFYRGPWEKVYHAAQFTLDATKRTVRKKGKPKHWHGETGDSLYTSHDGGPRLMRSVIRVRSEHSRAWHPTAKPIELLRPLIDYACPVDGVVLDPFMGSGSTLLAARLMGRRAIGIEIAEKWCEVAVQRLAQLHLPMPPAPTD